MDPVIDTSLRVALVLLFVSAAVHKGAAFTEFRATLADYRLVPGPLVGLTSRGLVGAEIGLAIGLLLPALREAALLGAAGLLLVYGIAIGVNLARGRRHIDCGCMGPAMRQSLSEWLVVRNGVLIGVALTCLVPVRPRSLLWVDFVTIVGGVAVLAATFASVNHLIANAPSLARLRGRP
jgi:hypothetical protein